MIVFFMFLLTYWRVTNAVYLLTYLYQSQRPGPEPRYIRVNARGLDPGILVSTFGAWTPVYQSPLSGPVGRVGLVVVIDECRRDARLPVIAMSVVARETAQQCWEQTGSSG